MPARGRAAFAPCYTTWCAPYYPLLRSRWRLCRLWMRHTLAGAACQSRGSSLITVYRSIPQCGERQQCCYFARSLPPRKRHSRLTIVRRGCKRSRLAGIHGEAMYTTPDYAACVIRASGCQCAGSRGTALAFSLGSIGAILSRENGPLIPMCARGAALPLQTARSLFHLA